MQGLNKLAYHGLPGYLQTVLWDFPDLANWAINISVTQNSLLHLCRPFTRAVYAAFSSMHEHAPFAVLGAQPMALSTLGKHSTALPCSNPCLLLISTQGF